VGLVHSQLSEGERYDTWRRARLGLLKVVIGPRSALFYPAAGYRPDRSGRVPRWIVLPVRAAVLFGRQRRPPVRPPVRRGLHPRLGHPAHRFAPAGRGRESLRLLELPERVGRRDMPAVRVVDMREELKSGNRGIFTSRW